MSDKPTLFSPPAKPKKDNSVQELANYIRFIEKDCKRRWVSFLHPIHGKVTGRCLRASHAGLQQPGNHLDFTLTIEGRAKSTLNTIDVSMIETYAQFFDTKQLAINDCKSYE